MVRDQLTRQGLNYGYVPNHVKDALQLPRRFQELLARCPASTPSAVTTAMSGSFNPGAHPKALHSQLSRPTSSSSRPPASGNKSQAPMLKTSGPAAMPQNSTSSGRPSLDSTCHYCGSPDHWVKDCLHPRGSAPAHRVSDADVTAQEVSADTALHGARPTCTITGQAGMYRAVSAASEATTDDEGLWRP